MCLAGTAAAAPSPADPLRPPDRSSPRAALRTFLDASDAFSLYLAQDYLPSPSRATFAHLVELGTVVLESLDLRTYSLAERLKRSRSAALSLYEVLNRISLPPLDQIPEADQLAPPPDGSAPYWVIPDTEIALVRVPRAAEGAEFLFSADTVARADAFYDRVHDLPYRRAVPLQNLKALSITDGGWMIPHAWIQAWPAFLRAPLADQALWKWIGLVLILLVLAALLWAVGRLARLGRGQSPLLHALAQLALPASILGATPVVIYLVLIQLNLTNEIGIALSITGIVVMYLAGAWLVWRLASVVAEAIISSPRIGPDSIDAHLIRVASRLLGIVGSAALLALGASKLGIPVYGIVAGLGVGGLAIALAAQPTIENLIGGLNLFADRPIRVGEFCKYGTDVGTVETIGIRSTRIRGPDRTLTTIPNAALARMPIQNFSRRDRMLLQTVIGLRHETTPEQLRYVLVKLRELLLGHPRLDLDTARVRLVGFGTSSLDLELFGYVLTQDGGEFMGIREDLLLRVMDVVEEAGTALALPSQTLRLGRDQGPPEGKVAAAEAMVRAWREGGALPFPDFSPEQARQLQGSIAFPPPGSVTFPPPGQGPEKA